MFRVCRGVSLYRLCDLPGVDAQGSVLWSAINVFEDLSLIIGVATPEALISATAVFLQVFFQLLRNEVAIDSFKLNGALVVPQLAALEAAPWSAGNGGLGAAFNRKS